FILTLMSVWWDKGRRQLEEFSRAAIRPSAGSPSPFNHFIEPSPDQLLRVAVGLGFRRGRLQHVYSLLRGKDLETGIVSPERREEQFAVLRDAQDSVVDLTNWHEFLKCLTRAGFRSSRMISSENALLYTYALWLVGRRDFVVDLPRLRDVIARWFFMAHTTGRYTTSPESQIEGDLTRLRDLKPGDADGFCQRLDHEVATAFTNDYWAISLPNRLNTAAAKSPALLAYWAALNLLDAELLFSTTKVSTLLDPGVTPVRNIERHHLFPKQYLESLGITGATRTNQIANMAFVDWADNTAISSNLDSRTANRTLAGRRSPRSTSPTSRSWQRFERCQANGPWAASLNKRASRGRWRDRRTVPALAGRVCRIAVPERGMDWAPVARLGPSPVRVQRHHPYPSTAAAAHWLGSKGIDASPTRDPWVSDGCSRIRANGEVLDPRHATPPVVLLPQRPARARSSRRVRPSTQAGGVLPRWRLRRQPPTARSRRSPLG
ncbi:MAG: hypothetical protein ACRDGH_07550, partial [Candidatus Limnocylindria bacterium]